MKYIVIVLLLSSCSTPNNNGVTTTPLETNSAVLVSDQTIPKRAASNLFAQLPFDFYETTVILQTDLFADFTVPKKWDGFSPVPLTKSGFRDAGLDWNAPVAFSARQCMYVALISDAAKFRSAFNLKEKSAQTTSTTLEKCNWDVAKGVTYTRYNDPDAITPEAFRELGLTKDEAIDNGYRIIDPAHRWEVYRDRSGDKRITIYNDRVVFFSTGYSILPTVTSDKKIDATTQPKKANFILTSQSGTVYGVVSDQTYKLERTSGRSAFHALMGGAIEVTDHIKYFVDRNSFGGLGFAGMGALGGFGSSEADRERLKTLNDEIRELDQASREYRVEGVTQVLDSATESKTTDKALLASENFIDDVLNVFANDPNVGQRAMAQSKIAAIEKRSMKGFGGLGLKASGNGLGGGGFGKGYSGKGGGGTGYGRIGGLGTIGVGKNNHPNVKAKTEIQIVSMQTCKAKKCADVSSSERSKVVKKLNQIRRCYSKELAFSKKPFDGKIVLEIVSPGSNPKETTEQTKRSVNFATDEIKKAKLNTCIKRNVAAMRFKQKDDVRAKVRLKFSYTRKVKN